MAALLSVALVTHTHSNTPPPQKNHHTHAVGAHTLDPNRSLTRRGLGKSIGFVADERRINVGITRARKTLIIIGNARALQVSCSALQQGRSAHCSSTLNLTTRFDVCVVCTRD